MENNKAIGLFKFVLEHSGSYVFHVANYKPLMEIQFTTTIANCQLPTAD